MYNCKACAYETGDKSNYNKHQLSKKHLLKTGNNTQEKDTEKPVITKIYKCNYEKCDYKSPNKSNYNRHIMIHEGNIENIYKYKCKACDEKIRDTYALCSHFRTQNHIDKVRENFPETVKSKSSKIGDKEIGPKMGLDLSKRNVYIKDLKDKDHIVTGLMCVKKEEPKKDKKITVKVKKNKIDFDDEDEKPKKINLEKPKHIKIKDYFKYEYYELNEKEIKEKVNEMYEWLKKYDVNRSEDSQFTDSLIYNELPNLEDEINDKKYDLAYLDIYNLFTGEYAKDIIDEYKLNAS